MQMFLRNKESLRETLYIVKEFSKHAGSKLNIDKTECILTCRVKSDKTRHLSYN